MDFRGHLRLPEDAGTGIPVRLRLDDIFIVISSDGDELGSWRADDIVISRIFSNQFSIDLDGEPMVFVAQDALGFAYDGITAIEDLQERLTKRRTFKRSKKREKPPVETPRAQPSEVVRPAAGIPRGQTPEPVAVDDDLDVAFAATPKPIWSPPSAKHAAPAAEPEPEAADFEPLIPEPLRDGGEESPAETPADVRVSYAASSRSPEEPPADLGEPSSTRHAPAVPTEPDVAESVPEPEAATKPEAEPAYELEYEIEEIGPAASGANWLDEGPFVGGSEPEYEIEESVLPAAGVADIFTPGVSDAAGRREPTGDAREVDDRRFPRDVEVPEPEPVPDISVPETEPEPVPETPVVPVSNGHLAPPAAEEPETRERRHSLFGRSRDKKVAPHDHRYGEPKTIGGLTRQVCEVCGHVTFSAEDAYQGW